MSECKPKKRRRKFELLPEVEREAICKQLPLHFATLIYDGDSIPLSFRKCEEKYDIQMKVVRQIIRYADLVDFVKANVTSRHNTAKHLFMRTYSRTPKGKKDRQIDRGIAAAVSLHPLVRWPKTS